MAQNVVINVAINNRQGVQSIGQLNAGLTTTLTTIYDLENASQLLQESLRGTEFGTQRFRELSDQLNVVNTELRNAELAMEVLDNEQLVGSVKGLAGGLTDLAGGMALLGASGEGIEKIAETFAKVEGLSKIVGGALDVYNEGMKVVRAIVVKATAAQAALTAAQTTNTVAVAANTVAETTNATATTVATTATTAQGNASAVTAIKMRALNLVMKANPVFLLITGIGLLVGAFALFSSSADDAKEKQEDLKKSFDDTTKSIESLNKAYKDISDTYSKRDIIATQGELILAQDKLNDLLRDAPTEYGKIKDAQNEVSRLSLENIRTENQEKVKQFDLDNELESKRINLIKNRINQIKKLTDDESVSEKKALNDELTSLELNQITANQRRLNLVNEGLNSITSSEIDAQNKIAEIERKAQDDRKKLMEERKKGSEELLKAVKRIADEEQLYLAKTEEEKLKILFERSQQELQLIYDKSEKSLVDQKKLKQGLKDLEEKYAYDVNVIIKKREEEAQKIIDDAKAEAKKLAQQQAVEDADLVQEGLDKANDLGKTARQLELQANADYYYERIELARQLYGEESEEYLKLVTARGSEEERIKKEFDDKEKEDRLQKYNDIANDIANTVQQTTDLISQILQNRNALEEFYRNERFDKDEQALKNSLANRLITQEEYDAKFELLNQKKREEEKKAAQKAFKQQKAIAILNATMQTATAVLAAYSSGVAVPIIGPATGAIYAGIAAALGAAQIGVIASQKFTAARGGVVPGSGPSTIDSVNALLAPGEMVINANSAKMFAPILSDINQAGGGVPLAPDINNNRGSNNNSQQSIRAYVVESDITTTQNRVSRFERRKEF